MTADQLKIVMLIDDNPTDRFVHSKLLEIHKIGKKILSFEGAKQALNYLRLEGTAADGVPDVILLDVSMPDMNGFDFLVYYQELMDTLPSRPALFMLSSTDDEGDLKRARKNPLVRKMLKKPFAPDTLIKALEEI